MIYFVRSDGKELNLNGFFKIYEMTGLGNINNENYSEKRAFGNGDVHIGKRAPSRIINIASRCVSGALNEVSRQTARSFFNRNFTFKMYVSYKDFKGFIPCEIDFVDLPTDNIHFLQNLNLSLYCADPFFRSINEFGKDIASIKPMLAFPLVCVINKGFNYGLYNFAKTVFIDNDGDEETFCKAIIKAEGFVQNFKLSKNTDEYVLFLEDLNAGDELVIDFITGYVTINGVKDNNKVDRRSTFFSIDIGGSDIAYNADIGENVVKVYIYYNKLYAGV